MPSGARSPVTRLVESLLPRLRSPLLLAVLAGLLLVDLVVPDPIPLIDEIVLAILTFLAATWRTPRPPANDEPGAQRSERRLPEVSDD